MSISILLFILVGLFIVHFIISIAYYISQNNIYLIAFFITGFVNICIMCYMAWVAIKRPEVVQELELELYLWILSGVIMFSALFLKVYIAIRILSRTKDPEYYHLNYFGKKVLHGNVVKRSEFGIMLMTLPFFTISGAYFVARLINLIIYGHL